jgi:hypothetical protein
VGLVRAAKEKLDFNVVYEIYEICRNEMSDLDRVKLLVLKLLDNR